MTADIRSHDDDRETLSALFDGELQGDAARFALRRLGHDEQWRRACGRWQLYGDVLRGQAAALAPGGFAERVAAAIAEDGRSEQARAATGTGGALGRRAWIGGALAASVAVAALFVSRPLSQDAGPAAPASTPVASARPAPAEPTPAPAATSAPAPRVPAAELALGAVAAAEAPRRALERRNGKARAGDEAGARAARRSAAERAAAPPVLVAGAEPMPSGARAGDPFLPPAHEATPRPWPRAVLPQYSSGGEFNARYGDGAQPSFYPFEPVPAPPPGARLPSEPTAPRP